MGKLLGNRPPEELAEARAQRAWELRQQGWTEARIAADLGITQQAVSKALRKITKELAAEFKDRAEEIKAEHTARLEQIADMAMQAFAASQQDAVCITTKTGRMHVDKEGTKTPLHDEVTASREGQAGDPRFLAQAREALGDIRTIWGADAPTEVKIEESATVSIVRVPTKMTVEEWMKSAQAQQTAQKLMAQKLMAQKLADQAPTSTDNDG